MWHQLTNEIQAFIAEPDVRAAVPTLEFYEQVIANYAPKANQLRLAAVIVQIASDITGMLDLFQLHVFEFSGYNHVLAISERGEGLQVVND